MGLAHAIAFLVLACGNATSWILQKNDRPLVEVRCSPTSISQLTCAATITDGNREGLASGQWIPDQGATKDATQAIQISSRVLESFDFTTRSEHCVTLSVKDVFDREGLGEDCASLVSNAPEIRSQRSELVEGHTYLFQVTADDKDPGQRDALEYEWRVGETVRLERKPNQTSFHYTFASSGKFGVTVTVFDPDELQVSAVFTVEITE